MTQSKRMGTAEWILLVTLSIIWGGTFFFNAVLVEMLPTLTIVLGRVAIGALGLWLVLFALGRRIPADRRIWLAFLGMGVLNNVIPFGLLVWGQASIASGLAAIINATTPVFTVLVAHVFTADERLTPARIVAIGFGLGGVAVMMSDDLLSNQLGPLTAQLACVGAAISYAFAGVYGRRFARMGVGPLQTATGQVTASSLVLCLPVLLIDAPWTYPLPGLGGILALIALGLLGTSLAYIIFFRILERAGATNLHLVTLLIPVSAILLGALILGEVLAPRHGVGMALIALALILIDGRLIDRLRGS